MQCSIIIIIIFIVVIIVVVFAVVDMSEWNSLFCFWFCLFVPSRLIDGTWSAAVMESSEIFEIVCIGKCQSIPSNNQTNIKPIIPFIGREKLTFQIVFKMYFTSLWRRRRKLCQFHFIHCTPRRFELIKKTVNVNMSR